MGRLTHLHADPNVLEHLVNDVDGEVRVIPVEVVEEHGEQVDVAVLDLPDLREPAMELLDDLRRPTPRQRRPRR